MRKTKLILSKSYTGEELADISDDIDYLMDELVPSEDPDEMGMKGELAIEVVQVWEEENPLPNHEFDF